MQAIPFGRYLLLERLALGGTAEIFKAKLLGIEGFEKTVVIKRILPHWSANANFISMLIDEAKIMVRLSHERIVQVYELGREGENYYIAMEYIAGTDLRKLTDSLAQNQKKLKTEEALYIVSEILRGLEYIHKQSDEQGNKLKIVHRDISPQNILISTEGAIKIADFGIAHAASRSYETATGVLKGKFAYMSPEQARGDSLDARTDIFATGIILFELLTAQRLFAGGSDLNILERVKNFSLNEIEKTNLAPELKTILRKALSPHLKERYFSAQDFLEDILRVQKSLNLFAEPNALGAEVYQSLKSHSSPSQQFDTLAARPPQKMSSAQTFSFNTSSDPLENTRSMSQIPQNILEPNNSVSRSRKRIYLSLSFLFLIGFLLFIYKIYFTSEPPPKEFQLQARAPESSSLTPLAESAPLSAPISEKNIPKENPKTPPTNAPEISKGLLSVRALPWGKISVSGQATKMEKPFSKQVPYGNYQIQVSYKGLQGDRILSKSVRVAKASTACLALFHPDGTGALTCR